MPALEYRTDYVFIVGGAKFDPAVITAHEPDGGDIHIVDAPPSPAPYHPVDTASESVAQIDARVPLVLHHLIASLTPLRDVLAVIAESIGDHGAVHITVFADPLVDATRESVYAAERDLLETFADMTFDFHLRQPERVNGEIVIPPAPQALVLWHRADVDAIGG